MNKTVIELMILKAVGTVERTKLQRMAFILKEKNKIPISVDYRMYFNGPHSEGLTYDLAALEAFGCISVVTARKDGYIFYKYRLTRRGENMVKKYLHTELFRKIKEGVKELKNMTSEELLQEARIIRRNENEGDG